MCDIEFLKNQIKNNLTIEEVITHYLGFAGRGGRWKCPFNHDEEHLNLAVNGKRSWRCFSCQESGDEIKFVMKLFNLDMKEAMQKIADDFGLCCEADPAEIQAMRMKEQALRRRREREKQQKANIEKYEIVVLTRIAKKLAELEHLIKYNTPFNINNIENYSKSASCGSYFKALKQLDWYNTLYDIVSENDIQNETYYYIYPADTKKDKETRKIEFLRKIYKGELQI